MVSLFGTVAEYIFGQGLQVAGVFVAVWALCLLFRRASSHVRYLLWLLVIAKCVFPSVMKVSLAVFPEKEVAPVIAEAVTEPMFYGEPVIASGPWEFETGTRVETTAQSSAFDWVSEIGTFQWCGIVWTFGAVLFLGVVCFRTWRLNRRLRSLRTAAKLNCEVSGFDDISVWQIDGIGQPFVWGVFRGSVYVPGNFDKCGSVADQRGILMHEFAHVRRFDAGVNVLQIIAQGLFWFHPLVWIANNMVRREREKCCDEAAIARLKSVPRDYGNAIIDTLTREYESNIPVPSLAVAGPVKNIEDRLKTIMRPGKKFYTRCGIFALITIVLLAIVALPVGCVLTTRDVAVENQGTVVEDAVMEERFYDVPVLKLEGDDIVIFRERSEKETQRIVDYIKNHIFSTTGLVLANKGAINFSEFFMASETYINKPKAKDNVLGISRLAISHAASVHEKIEAYIEKLKKDFYSRHGITDEQLPFKIKVRVTRSAAVSLTDSNAEQRSYDIGEILRLKNKELFESDADYQAALRADLQQIIDNIKNYIFPPQKSGDSVKSSIQTFGMNTLFIYHLPSVHEKVEAYLEQVLQGLYDKHSIVHEESPVMFYGFDLSRGDRALKSDGLYGLPSHVDISIRHRINICYQEDDGTVFYIRNTNEFYVKYDGPGYGSGFYYGPFDGDPRTVIKDLPRGKGRTQLYGLDVKDDYLEMAKKAGAKEYYNKSELSEVFEEIPRNSGKYQTRKDVIVFRDYYYLPLKNVFYHVRKSVMGFANNNYFGPLPGEPRKMLMEGPYPDKDQVSIESRFIVCDPDFLDDLSIMSSAQNLKGSLNNPKISYEFFEGSKPMDEGKAAGFTELMGIDNDLDDIGIYVLDYEKVDLLLRAIEAQKYSRTLTAPKITLVDGEPGTISVTKNNRFISGYKEVAGDKGESFEPIIDEFETGLEVGLTPTISSDGKYVLVKLECMLNDLISFEQTKHESGKMYDVSSFQQTQFDMRWRIRDGETLMITGLKNVEKVTETNWGVFEHERLEARELIILVKPTIIGAKE